MKFFRSKSRKDAPVSAHAARSARSATDGQGNGTQPSHRLTVDLARAERIAAMLARSRAAKFVEVADLLAGMYIYEWERLSRFWDDRDEIESLLRKICSISPQRWNYWIEYYDKQRHDDENDRLSTGRSPKEPQAEQREALERSSELKKILVWAEEIAPFRDDVNGRKIPVLTSECVLLSIARNPDSDLSRNLRDTGLDLSALERIARDPRRAPQR